jgi:hypothetical protein
LLCDDGFAKAHLVGDKEALRTNFLREAVARGVDGRDLKRFGIGHQRSFRSSSLTVFQTSWKR